MQWLLTKEFLWKKSQNKRTKDFLNKRDEKSNTNFLPLEVCNVRNNLLVHYFHKNIIKVC